MFNHSSREKIFQTLGVTRGYKQAHLPEADCAACPIGKAHRKGLSHKTSMAIETMDVKDSFTQSEPSSTTQWTLSVSHCASKPLAVGENSDEDFADIVSDSEDEATTDD